MELTQQQKRRVAINGVLFASFLILVIYMTATGLIWRVPHYLQALQFFAAGVVVATWAHFWREHH